MNPPALSSLTPLEIQQRRAAINPHPASTSKSEYVFIASHKIKRREKVFLNVYNLTGLNSFLRKFGLAIYHTSVEVYGVEIAFAGHPDSTSGIIETRPFHTLKGLIGDNVTLHESKCVGYTAKKYNEIMKIVETMVPQWPGNSYSLLNRNCNHFSEAFLKELLNVSIPNYVNRLARVSAKCSCCLPGILTQDWPVNRYIFSGLGYQVGAKSALNPAQIALTDAASELREKEQFGCARQMAELAAIRRIGASNLPKTMKMEPLVAGGNKNVNKTKNNNRIDGSSNNNNSKNGNSAIGGVDEEKETLLSLQEALGSSAKDDNDDIEMTNPKLIELQTIMTEFNNKAHMASDIEDTKSRISIML